MDDSVSFWQLTATRGASEAPSVTLAASWRQDITVEPLRRVLVHHDRSSGSLDPRLAQIGSRKSHSTCTPDWPAPPVPSYKCVSVSRHNQYQINTTGQSTT
jgi:hypothetical protein